MIDLEKAHRAAQLIEAQGFNAFPAVAKIVGPDAAIALLVARTRHANGSADDFAPADAVKKSTDTCIQEHLPDLYGFISHNICSFYMGRFYCLDNFSAFPVKYRDRLWITVEHAYQAAKFTNDGVISMFLTGDISAHEAKRRGNDPRYASYLRRDWESAKVGIMEKLLWAKVRQHNYVREVLLSTTETSLLVEDSPRDSFWGRGPNFDGQNMLGKLWMRIRTEVLAGNT